MFIIIINVDSLVGQFNTPYKGFGMKKLRYFNLLSLVVILLSSLSSCFTDGDDTKPNKTVIKYELKKVTDPLLLPGKTREVLSSLNGEYVYIIGKDKASLLSYSLSDKKYEPALGDFKGLKKASDRSLMGDLSMHYVDQASPSLDGLLFTLSPKKGLGVLRGSGVDNASFYPLDGIFNGDKVKPYWVKKDKDHFLYLFDLTSPKKSVYFRAYIEPPHNDTALWNASLKIASLPKEHFKHVFSGQVQDNKGNLLLADVEGIKRLLVEDIGKDKAVIDNQGKPIINIHEFSHDNTTKNDHITAMTLLDDKYLALGFSKTKNKQSGGLVVIDMSGLTHKVITKWGEGLSIKSIAIERHHPDRTRIGAIVSADTGLVFLDNNGKVFELVATKGYVVDGDYITNHQADLSYDNASNGFLGDKPGAINKDAYGGVAQDKDGLWYIVLNGDLYTLDIRSAQVSYPKPPPVLP